MSQTNRLWMEIYQIVKENCSSEYGGATPPGRCDGAAAVRSERKMSMTKYKTLKASRRGHPDKLCDLIADSILDECLRHDRYSRCACEVMATKGKIFVCGEINCAAKINIRSVVREVLRKVGYNPMKFIVFVYVHRQSPDIAGGVDSALEVRNSGSEDVFASTAPATRAPCTVTPPGRPGPVCPSGGLCE